MESMLTLSDAKARFSEMASPPKLGDLAGQIRISEDFDEWPADLQAALGMVRPSEMPGTP